MSKIMTPAGRERMLEMALQHAATMATVGVPITASGVVITACEFEVYITDDDFPPDE